MLRIVIVHIYLTAIKDSKWVYRLDNFLGPEYTSKMFFWDYNDINIVADVRKKSWVGAVVAGVHQMYRVSMGAIDQSDVKNTVMNITAQYKSLI